MTITLPVVSIDDFINDKIYHYHTKDDMNFSMEQFTSYFNIDDAVIGIEKAYSIPTLNQSYNENIAYKLAQGFSDCTVTQAGYKFKSDWCHYDRFDLKYDNNKVFKGSDSYKYSNEYLTWLSKCFAMFDNLDLYHTISDFMNQELYKGDKLEENGLKLLIYKSHYVIQLSKKVMDQVLLFINKYDAESLEKYVAKNQALAA